MAFVEKISILEWPPSRFGGPYIIGHRGACHHAVENTLPAFELASQLGSDMWELDVRNTADGVCVVSHDDDLSRVFGVDAKISDLTFSALQTLRNVNVPTLKQTISLASQLGAGLYIEIKAKGAGQTALRDLTETGYAFAALGSFVPEYVAELVALKCPYPLTSLVRVGQDPFEQAKRAHADAIHLCWEAACERPDRLLTPALLERADKEGLAVFLWHEERPDVIQAVMQTDVAGVCTNRPELLVPYATSPSHPSGLAKGPEIVCHRGINKLAPENTLPAAQLVFEQGFDWLELDVHETVDGVMVVIHDQTLERTTNGSGLVAEKDLSELRALDAGSWFAPQFIGTHIPTLAEMIDLAKIWDKKIYIELKNVDPAKLLTLVEEKDFLHKCFFWGYEAEQLQIIRSLSPTACIMARSLDYDLSSDAIVSINAEIIEINMAETEVENKVVAARQLGAKVMLCYMGKEASVFKRMIALEPDMVNLDQPQIWKDLWHQTTHAKSGKNTS